MHRYFIKTPWWLHKIFPAYTWKIPTAEKIVYLTFDDGPHPTLTPWVLEELDKAGAKATFFCIGENVQRFPDVYARILCEGHAVGNHTQRHLNGWKTKADTYVADTLEAKRLIDGSLFRPPYGRIRRRQAKALAKVFFPRRLQLIMWTVLSCDFDQSFTAMQCEENVLKNAKPGSIVVFHDSEKAETNLRGSLPAVLKRLAEAGYRFEKINMG